MFLFYEDRNKNLETRSSNAAPEMSESSKVSNNYDPPDPGTNSQSESITRSYFLRIFSEPET